MIPALRTIAVVAAATCLYLGCKATPRSQQPAGGSAQEDASNPNLCVAPQAVSVTWEGPREWPTDACRARASDLLSGMTLEAKAAQMMQVDCMQLEDIGEMKTLGVGAVLCGADSAPKGRGALAWADYVDRFHKNAAQAPHGIPVLFGIDAIHGHNAVRDAVIFPHNIGLGATREPALLERIARVTGEDVRATGINWVFAPVLAAAQDERWGRTYESYSEDPSLVAELGAAVIRGLQSEVLGGSPTSVLATAKHYIADGNTEGGVDRGRARVDEAYLRERLLPVYRRAVELGVGSVMLSFSKIDDTKMHCNGPVVTDTLKRELGFNGFVVSDWEAIELIPGNYSQRLAQSINAGVDMVMHPADYASFVPTLASLVPEQVSVARIDDAVRRILAVKCEMGLLGREEAAPRPTLAQRDKLGLLRARQRLELAREAVRKSVVLLENDDALPLAKSGTIHVAGRHADDLGSQCGGWTMSWQGSSGAITEGTTIVDGIREVAGSSAKVTYSSDGSGAVGASVGVVVVGELPYAEMKGDARDLTLSAQDVALFRKVKATGIPVVVVLVSGRPLILEEIREDADAIVAAWLPGTEGGGIADVLFGDVAPTGKLSFTWPASMDQIPIDETEPGQAAYPFGHGLTYPGANADEAAGP